MLNCKKTAAMAMCLCLCASAAVCPLYQSHAESESSKIAQEGWEDTTEASTETSTEASTEDTSEAEDTSSASEETTDAAEEDESGEKTSGDYTYVITDDGNACLTAVRDKSPDLVIPDKIDDLTVTEMGADIFATVSPEKVTIPATIEYIYAENCFSRCDKLKEIAVDPKNENYCAENGILYTKDKTCLFCYPQKKAGDSFTVPTNVTKLAIAAIYATQLKELKLHSGITEISRHSLAMNEYLTSIDMSMMTIEKLPVMLCAGCSSLTEVKFPQKMTEIGGASFMSCTSLSEITIPDTVLMIGQAAFRDTALKRVRIPSSVRLIDYCAFGYDLNENPVPGFTIVGDSGSAAEIYATDKDADYGYVNDFEFVLTEADDVLQEYKSLDPQTSGEYQYSITGDNEAMLLMCTVSDEEVVVPDEIDGYTITSIFKGAFLNCTSASITLPANVRTIGEAPFGEYLESLTIPGCCETIEGYEPFITCTSLKEINVTEGDGAFASRDGVLFSHDFTNLILYPQAKEGDSYTVPNETVTIALSAFCGNNNIKRVIMTGVEAIGNYAFDGCGSLEKVTFADKLESVGDHAFYNCVSLKSIRLGASVKEIGDYAVGFVYDSEAGAEAAQNGATGSDLYDVNKVMEGFKIYTDEGTLAYQYADHYGIEVVTGTVAMGEKNVSTGFLNVVLGIISACALGIAGVFAGKTIKAKRAEKKKAAAKKKKEDNK